MSANALAKKMGRTPEWVQAKLIDTGLIRTVAEAEALGVRLLASKDVARLLGVTTTTIRDACNSGRLAEADESKPHRRLFTIEAVVAWQAWRMSRARRDYMPSQEQIRKECERIRATWSRREERRRREFVVVEWSAPRWCD